MYVHFFDHNIFKRFKAVNQINKCLTFYRIAYIYEIYDWTEVIEVVHAVDTYVKKMI